MNESPKSVMRTCPSESMRMLLACKNERWRDEEGKGRDATMTEKRG